MIVICVKFEDTTPSIKKVMTETAICFCLYKQKQTWETFVGIPLNLTVHDHCIHHDVTSMFILITSLSV